MELICSSLGCDVEKPVEYCKQCSHANWIVDKDTTFNPRFGVETKKDTNWDDFEKWLEEFEKLDIKKTSFKLD